MKVRDLADIIYESGQDLTLSGGEPFEQFEPVLALLKEVKRKSPEKSILVFTGYYMEELETMVKYESLEGLVDVLVSGRYIEKKRNPNKHTLASSSNQKVIRLSSRHTEEELEALNRGVEVMIGNEVKITGFPSRELIREMKKELS
jgi:anaerobic ribonucleoside-triphosphate reductase activating protein